MLFGSSAHNPNILCLDDPRTISTGIIEALKTGLEIIRHADLGP